MFPPNVLLNKNTAKVKLNEKRPRKKLIHKYWTAKCALIGVTDKVL